MTTRNSLLADIVVASGGTVTQPETRNSLLSDWLNSVTNRFFRLNEGTTDRYTIPEAAINTGDILKFNYTASNAQLSSEEFLFDSDGVAANRGVIRLEVGGEFRAEAGGQNWASQIKLDGIIVSNSGFNYPIDGKIHAIEITSGFNDIRFGYICSRRDGALNYGGVIFDIEIIKSSALVNRYAIDDNSNTIKDSIGGFDGAVINGNPDDWGLFSRTNIGWIGSGLAVPPWDSVNQELIFA